MSFEVGDKVIDLRLGKGTVTTIHHNVNNPIHVEFEKQGEYGNLWDDYTQEGFTAL